MIKMENIYQKTGIMVVLALLVVMSAPDTVAAQKTMSVTWEDPCINATAWDASFKNDMYYQFRYYEPGTSYADRDDYFNSTIWLANKSSPPYTDHFNVASSGATNITGIWTVWLFKGGTAGSNPVDSITSDRVHTTVDVSIPEFVTIAIPTIAMLGLFALYRRKQKK
ncbi:MAG: hypothetical protein U9N36_01305 [Euryarchaeota archaeon]|nr:hypothetical protein [Euryarchaeota archaeon]